MAARKTPLRAVTAEEAQAPRKRLTITAAADDGDRRELLVALRTRVAKAVEDPNCPARDLAALSRRLLEIAKEIEALDAEEQGDDIGLAANTPDESWSAR